MKKLKIWTLLSLLTLSLAACNVANNAETEPTAPANDTTTESERATSQPDLAPTPQPTLAAETAVPTTDTTEITRTIRLTPVATTQVKPVPTLDETAVVGEVPDEIMTAVYEDIITNENIAKEAINIIRAEAIIWSDGALGCPQPGQAYTQATVPGYWIVLEANGRTYDYRAAESGYFILCQNNQPPSPPVVGTPNS